MIRGLQLRNTEAANAHWSRI